MARLKQPGQLQSTDAIAREPARNTRGSEVSGSSTSSLPAPRPDPEFSQLERHHLASTKHFPSPVRRCQSERIVTLVDNTKEEKRVCLQSQSQQQIRDIMAIETEASNALWIQECTKCWVCRQVQGLKLLSNTDHVDHQDIRRWLQEE